MKFKLRLNETGMRLILPIGLAPTCCNKCGVSLTTFQNLCDTCNRDEKIEKILKK